MQRKSFKAAPLFLALLLACALFGVIWVVATEILFPLSSGRFPLRQKWSYRAGEHIVAVSVSTEDVVVARTSTSTFGLDAATGSLLWSSAIGSRLDPAPARFADCEVFVANSTEVWALEALNGKTLWNAPGNDTTDMRVIALSECCVLVNRASIDIIAYDRSTGEARWNIPTSLGFVTAHSENGVVYVADRGIQALDEMTGKVLWTTGVQSIGDSEYRDGVLYYNESGFRIVAFDTERQVELWSSRIADHGPSEVTKAGEYLLVVSSTSIYALRADTGQQAWKTDLDKGRSATAVGDVVYIASDFQQSVIALQAATGTEMGYLRFGFPRLFVVQRDNMAANNDLLIIGEGDDLYAYGKP